MYEFLKNLFLNAEGQGEAITFEQFSERLTADGKIKIANLADGGYVAKDKYDALDTKFKGVEKQLKDANDTIKTYTDMDIDGIKQSVSDWESKYNADTKALQDKLDAQARAHREEQFMSGYKFTSKAAAEGVLAKFRSKEFKLDNDTFLGAKEFMDSLMKDEDYKGAFKIDEPPTDPPPTDTKKQPKWGDPKPAGGGKGKTTPSLTELMKQKNANPDMEIKFD